MSTTKYSRRIGEGVALAFALGIIARHDESRFALFALGMSGAGYLIGLRIAADAKASAARALGARTLVASIAAVVLLGAAAALAYAGAPDGGRLLVHAVAGLALTVSMATGAYVDAMRLFPGAEAVLGRFALVLSDGSLLRLGAVMIVVALFDGAPSGLESAGVLTVVAGATAIAAVYEQRTIRSSVLHSSS